jgi:hypothetical protein
MDSAASPSPPAKPRASELRIVVTVLASVGLIGCLFIIALAGSDNYTPYLLFKAKEIPYTHGWPWQFAERVCPAELPWVAKRFALGTHVKAWSTQLLLADLGVFVVASAGVLLIARRIWRSRGLRFTLGTAGILLTAACCGMGYLSYHQRLARREMQIVERLDASTSSECGLDARKYRGPRWWLQLVGYSSSFDGAMHHYTGAHLRGHEEQAGELGRLLAKLPYLRTLEVSNWSDARLRELLAASDAWPIEALEWRGDFTGAGLSELPRAQRLKRLHLFSLYVDDSATKYAAHCPQLEDLWTYGLDDLSAPHLAKAARLRLLEAPQTKLSDAGLAPLVACQQLEEINLRAARLTERSLETLRQFPKLKQLSVGPFPAREPDDHARFAKRVAELGIERAEYHPQ